MMVFSTSGTGFSEQTYNATTHNASRAQHSINSANTENANRRAGKALTLRGVSRGPWEFAALVSVGGAMSVIHSYTPILRVFTFSIFACIMNFSSFSKMPTSLASSNSEFTK